MSTKCYTPVKGVDDVIAAKVPTWNVFRVATLRGMYDESHDTPLDVSNPDVAIANLLSFRKKLGENNAKLINTNTSNLAEAQQKLKNSFSTQERFDRINMVSTMFSKTLDRLQKANPSISRKALSNGFKVEGRQVAGQMSIFESVYDQLMLRREQLWSKGYPAEADKISKVLNNWGSIVSYARINLRNTEGLKLGNRLEFADDTNINNYGDNDISTLFDMSEATREAWQETNDKQSAFGSIGVQVRNLLGNIQNIVDGKPDFDDLGFPRMLDAVKAHQNLMEILRGVTSEKRMLSILNKYSKYQPWINSLISALQDNNQLRTQFYVDFKKNFQPYSKITESIIDGLKQFKTILLNRRDSTPNKQYLTAITLGKQQDAKLSVYNTDGSINWSNIQGLRNLTEQYFVSNPNNILEKDPKFKSGVSWETKREVILTASKALGINLDSETLTKIMSKEYKMNQYIKQIDELVKHGINKALTNNELEKLSKGDYNISNDSHKRSFNNFIRFTPTSSTAKEGVIREKINKLINMITDNREGMRLDSSVLYKDRNGNNITLSSNVNPAYLGDLISKIESFVSENDMNGLKRMLESEYLNSSFFNYEGNILNTWIKDLYESTSNDTDFAANFKFERLLGTGDNNFENFTSKQHAISMLSQYFSDKQISNKSKYAHYPVFILGDSGVSKYIKARRYSSEESGQILEGLYNVYRQERRRMELTKAANSKLISDGYKTIDNFSSKENEFSTLLFLNKDYKSSDGSIGKYNEMLGENPSKQDVTKVIASYMRESVKDFKNNLEKLGLLEQNKGGQFIYLSQEVKKPEDLDKVLADYYWNTKFATIQQIQMMTIDPAFYKGTKDLQKRYKEIHAPGTPLSLEAIDFNGNLYNPLDEFGNPQPERCVYFDDIDINAELSNPEFMQAIANKFGVNSSVYKAYKSNTLTDGQGYRTLDSYRKVMGMSGKWTQEMQNAYDKIKDLRSSYGRNEVIPHDKLEEISNLSVVFQPIKPYMFTIENYPVNNSDILKIPVQHKYAEAVLIPELLPNGSKLKDMAYWMEDQVDESGKSSPIDLIGSTKIVKVGGFGSTDISKANNSALLNEALSKGYIHQLNYGDYRIQTNVPEHINSSQLFGTQVRKLIMANIKMNDYHYTNYVDGNRVNLGGKYQSVNINGRNLVNFYNSLIVSNILDSYSQFSSEVSDISKLSDKLQQVVINNSRESMDNMLAYSLTNDNKFLIPLFEGALEHDSAAMLFSMFKKKVNKQSIKGGSAVQVSAMGIKDYEEAGDLHYVVDPNNSNNIIYAECEIPFDLSFTDHQGNEVPLVYEDYCNEDGTLKLNEDGTTIIESKFPNILDILAYRIPTERDYSMINLKVKRFSHKTAGGTIKVPAQGTTIAGFDFDIDKLYFMRREFKQKQLSSKNIGDIWNEFYNKYSNIKDFLLEAREEDTESLDRLYKYWDKAGLPYSYQEAFNQYLADNDYIGFENYDYSKSPLDNTKAARNNMLIQLIQRRLMDEETFEQRYTPGGFANASKAARFLRELIFGNSKDLISNGKVNYDLIKERAKDKNTDPEPNYDPSDPMTIITYNQQNQVASKLIGVFANQNTNHAFSSLLHTFILKNPIEFAGHSYYDLIHGPQGVDVDLNIAELLSASVDTVKDPVLNFLNLNTITADAGAVLARIGYTTQEIGLLFNQPIIKEICDYSFNNNVNYDLAAREIIKKYSSNNPNYTIPKADPNNDFSFDKLANNIVTARVASENGGSAMDNEDFKVNQFKVAELFSSIQKVTGDVSQFVTSTKFTASNAVGSTFGDSYAQQMKVSKYMEKFSTGKGLEIEMRVTDTINTPVNNSNSSLSNSNQQYLESVIENPLAYEQAMYDMNRRANLLLNKYYPYETNTYKEVRSTLAGLTKSGTLDANTINSIHSDLLVYMLSQQEQSLFNGEMPIKFTNAEGIESVKSIREYFNKDFSKILYNLLESNKDLKALALFKYMQFPTNEKTGETSISIQGIGGLASYQKEEIKESWEELNAINPNLSRNLFLYNFYKLGFTFSPLAFMNLAPTQVKLSIDVGNDKSYIDFLNDVQDNNIAINPSEFAKQYILNHLDNYRLTYTPKGSDLKYLKSLVFKTSVAASSFTLDSNILGNDLIDYIIADNTLPKGYTAFRPCIIVNDIVYMAQTDSITDRFNISNNGSMTYYKTKKLGTTNKSLQYISNSELAIEDTQEFDSNTSGNTAVENEYTETPNVFDRNEVYNLIVDEYIKSFTALGMQQEEVEGARRELLANLELADDNSVMSLVESIKSAVRENGVIVLDEDMNPKQAC